MMIDAVVHAAACSELCCLVRMVDEVTLESSTETCLAWLFPPVVFKEKVFGVGGQPVSV